MKFALPAAVLLSLGPWLLTTPITVAQTDAAAPSLPPEGTVVATVDGVEILGSDVSMMYQTLPPQYRQIPLATIYDQLLDRFIDQKLVAADARKTGFLSNPDVKRRLDFLAEGAIQQVYFDAKLVSPLSEDNLRRLYKKRVAGMPRQEKIQARHILLKTKNEAMAVIKELQGGADFAGLARKKSIGPSGKNGGDLGSFGRGQMVPAFSQAAFAMKKGNFTNKPVKTQFGWHVIKVEERTLTAAKSYKEMAPELRSEITQQTIDKLVNGLRGKADIRKGGGGGIKRVP